MKKYITILFISVLLSHSVWAQENEATVEKGLASVHVGLLGTWLTYEKALSDKFALNGQLGLEGGFSSGASRFPSTSASFLYIFTPTITVEPRFYYDFSRRSRKGKKTLNNSANYFAFAATYMPGLFSVSNAEVTKVEPFVSFVPMIGLRRTLGKRFSFEFAVGYGAFIAESEVSGGLDLDLRFGYVFYKRKK